MNRTLSFTVCTLGCRLNQVESEAVSGAFLRAGFVIREKSVEHGPHIFVINTCTVTSKSEQKARRIIRKAATENPESLVFVTGCYAQLNGSDIEALAPNVIVVSQERKSQLLVLPAFLAESVRDSGIDLLSLKQAVTDRLSVPVPSLTKFDFLPQTFSFHTRASLKIQDGCNNFCAYCRIPYARGRSESMDFDKAVETAVGIEKNGYRELVLTGVNVTAYENNGRGLRELLGAVLDGTSRIRIRLSSLGPYDNLENFEYFVSEERICPHFHLSVQSGSDSILAAMGRKYRAERIAAITDILKKSGRDPFISGDIITGFPGETDDDFEASYRLISSCGFSDCHVFPYSPRPETRAFGMKNRVPERISGNRAERLSALAGSLYLEYAERQKGRIEDIIIEEKCTVDGREYLAGLSSNYLKVHLEPEKTGDVKIGDMLRVRLDNVSGMLFGQPLPPSGAASL